MRKTILMSLTMLTLASAAFAADSTATTSKPAAKAAGAKAAGAKSAGTKAAGANAAAMKDAAATDKAIAAIDAQIAAAKVDKTKPNWKTSLPIPKVVKFEAGKKYYMNMVTNKGAMKILLKPEIAPMHVTNLIYLSRMGYFEGIKFHRVIKGFMAQGGDPTGTGGGGPGYQFAGEFSANAKHDKAGVCSTANAGPNTDGSQFFIMFKAYPSLDGKYSIWGQVEEGLDTVKKLEDAGNPGDGPPTEPLNITKVTIEVK
jgi:peptidyl-prolyl cis-trans isomerase B (cyclophilin B)